MMVENTKNGRKSMKQESDSLKRIDFESAYDLIAPPNSLSMFMSVKSSHMWVSFDAGWCYLIRVR